MDPKHVHNENMDHLRPVSVEFNMGYILAATALAGAIVAGFFYWILSNTKKGIPHDFVIPSDSQVPRPQSSRPVAKPRQPTRQPVKPSLGTQTPVENNSSGGDTDNDSDGAMTSRIDDNRPKKKIGVKKMAKLEMKAEKKAAREAMLLEREERKREQEYLDQLKREEDEKLKQEEEKKEEEERLAKEEQAKKEHEAYLEMAATFEVEEEGYDPDQDLDSDARLAGFINYIKEQKVVLLEQLAAHFKMRAKDVVDRIQQLIADEQLVGIIDDRGKFISITYEELLAVSKFIKQRGRVTVDELVVNSNKLINLKPEVKAT